MNKYYFIALNCSTRAVPNDRIEQTLGWTAPDWLRFSRDAYLVAYEGEAAPLYQALKPVLHQEDNILIMRVELADRWGWASQLVIDWIKKHSP